LRIKILLYFILFYFILFFWRDESKTPLQRETEQSLIDL